MAEPGTAVPHTRVVLQEPSPQWTRQAVWAPVRAVTSCVCRGGHLSGVLRASAPAVQARCAAGSAPPDPGALLSLGSSIYGLLFTQKHCGCLQQGASWLQEGCLLVWFCKGVMCP